MTPFSAYATVRLFLDGMLAMMALYALLSFCQQRRAIYWQYALYIGTMIVVFRIDDEEYKRADYLPGVNFYASNLEAIAFILYIRFAILLIDIPRQDAFTYGVLKGMVAILGAGMLIDTALWLGHTADMVRSSVYTMNRFGVALTALVVVPRIIRLRLPVVNYFIAGSTLFVAGCLVALVINFAPSLFTREAGNPFTFPISFMQIGVVGEVLCFTLGMALRNQLIEREKIVYQAQLIEQLRENEQKQQRLERIRDDIARDLHDDVGSDLSTISILSQVAARQVERQPDEAYQTLNTIATTARHIITAMRETVWSLRSVETSLESFCFRLRETAEALFAHQSATQLYLHLPDDALPWLLPAEGRRDLLLMAKEMMHNALRHAQADSVTVRLWIESDVFCLSVSDDGRGFVYDPARPERGTGLRSMQQRASALGGQLRVDTMIGQGTRLTFSGPLVPAPQSEIAEVV